MLIHFEEFHRTMLRVPNRALAPVALALTLITGGCNGGDGSSPSAAGSSAGSAPAVNRPPAISGAPPAAVRQDEAYEFQPNATDPDGDALTFSIRNRPGWAAFEPASGRLHGVPGAANVGTYADVEISVSDGRASARLAAFTITVQQLAAGSATLSWTPPLTNADGSALTDLAGYRIYHGQSANALTRVIVIANAGATRWVVGDLSPATWYFAMTSFNSTGVESVRSGIVSRTVG